MRVRVRVCGLTRKGDFDAAVAAGADITNRKNVKM